LGGKAKAVKGTYFILSTENSWFLAIAKIKVDVGSTKVIVYFYNPVCLEGIPLLT
jgi:hypothetical protein